jgi:long-chain fatty acid transport protein
MNHRKALLAALLAPMITLGAGALSSVQAAGYAVFTQGAAALGQGNAATAHTQSPSTVFYNPALMNKLEGTQAEFGTTGLLVSREFTSAATGASTSNESAFFPSTFYVTHKFNDSLSAGLGVFSPFGLGTEWNDDWEGKYIATKSKLTTFDINPSVSYRIIPSLAVAVGLDVMLVDAKLERKIPVAPGIDMGQKFKGDGTGVGFNVGAAYDFNKDLTLGVSYRSSVYVDITGKSSTTLIATPLDSPGKASIRLPQQVTAGLAYQVAAPLTVEAGLRWEGWSAFKELRLTLDNGTLLPATQRNWHDTWGANLGGNYRLNDNVALLAGYVYGNSAVPDSTFDPSIPDAATHVFCLGTDLKFQRYKIALSYAYQLYEDRTKANAVSGGLPSPPFSQANGKYQTDAHLLAVSLGYQF